MYTGYTESRPRRKAFLSFSQGAGGGTDKVLPFFLAFIVLLAFPFQAASGQKKSDIGILGGTSYYLGDVNPFRHFYSPSPAGGLIFRYNFNPRNSIRFHGMYVRIKGDPADFPELNNNTFDPFTTNLVDMGMNMEFNFMPYEATRIRKDRYTPYVSGGPGYIVVLGGKSTPAISFGGGVKYNVTRRMSAGLEWSFRKTFSDMLDNQKNTGYENNLFFHNKDWYSIVGVFITYKIFDWGLDCAAYE